MKTMVKTKSLKPNEYLRNFPQKDNVDYKRLKDSIDINGIQQALTVCSDDSVYHANAVITGNRRLIAAMELGIVEIPVEYKKVDSEEDFMRLAYHLNISKTSKLSEIMKQIKIDIGDGLSVPEVATKFGFSEKSIYETIKIDTKELTEIAEVNFKNAVYMTKNRFFLDDEEIVEAAKTQNIDVLKAMLKSKKTKITLKKTGKPAEKKHVYKENRKTKFFVQLENTQDIKTIDILKLRGFLYGNVDTWF